MNIVKFNLKRTQCSQISKLRFTSHQIHIASFGIFLDLGFFSQIPIPLERYLCGKLKKNVNM